MSNSLSIQLRQPVPLLKRDVEVNGRELFKALGKAIADATFLNWNNVSLDFVELVGALGLGESEGEVAWRLVYTSSARAIYKLIQDNHNLIAKQHDQLLSLSEQLMITLNQDELVLDNDFFKNPKCSPITEFMQAWFRQWLESFVQEPIHAEVMSRRWPTYFIYALHDEWVENPNTYALLKAHLETPFSPAAQREDEWRHYGAWLQRQVEEPMFLEAFGLKQVFVPLCAYFNRKKAGKSSDDQEFSRTHQREDVDLVVVELEAELKSWLQKADPRDAICLISGGPGSGKSSFTKMWAATLSEEDIRVLFIPLHHFNADGDLVEAIGSYLGNTQFLRHNPLAGDARSPRLLLILDGLDELAMQGKVGAESAQAFVREVQAKVSQFNILETRLQVVLSGREVVVPAIFRKFGQILHVLPYFLSEPERRNYIDPDGYLAADRRQQWWQKYGEVTGRGYTQLPEELKQESLREITAQPLLNYLVALSFIGGRLEFTAESNLNEIYADLLTAIYDRDWEKQPHRSTEGIDQHDFERILEEIALSSWHGNGRTTTVAEIKHHCDSSDLEELLEIFQEGAKTGVTRLLTAFYFRQSGGKRDREETFEFTHKSFGEYLTAKRIVREMDRIYKNLRLKKEDRDQGWNEKQALTAWATTCGASAIDKYLFRYIADEVQMQYKTSPGVVQQWQTTFCELIAYMLGKGMPMEESEPRPSYHEEIQQSRNAEEALLAVLNACALSTQKLSTIKWPSPQAFGNWLSHLESQQTDLEGTFALQCLGYLNLENLNLSFRDLHWASLNGVKLDGARLDGASLDGVSLNGASLNRASLNRARLVEASLNGASLNGVSLNGASLVGASLDEASLVGARLDYASLDEASLNGASLNGASLNGASLDRASLVGAILNAANLDATNLKWAILKEAILKGANLERAILDGAILQDITWDEDTKFPSLEALKRAVDVPEALLQQLSNN